MKNKYLSIIIFSFCLIASVNSKEFYEKTVFIDELSISPKYETKNDFIKDLENILFEIEQDEKTFKETGYSKLLIVYFEMIDDLVSKYPDKLNELLYIQNSCIYGSLKRSVIAIIEREKLL